MNADTGAVIEVSVKAAATDSAKAMSNRAIGLRSPLRSALVASVMSSYGVISGHTVLHSTDPSRLPPCDG